MMRVILADSHNGAEAYIIQASGPEVAALEDAICFRARDLDLSGAADARYGQLLTRMLDDVRRPYEATR